MDLLSVKFGKVKVENTDASAGDVFVCSPERSLAKSLGLVFGVFELNGLPDYFNEAFKEIISDLQTEYYLPPFNIESGPEKRFEECVQRANRRLHKAINESIEEISLYNINALVGLSRANDVYLAYVGAVRADLLHLRKDNQLITIDILDNGDGKRAKPVAEKLFSNISSGQISSRDRIFVLSQNTANFISDTDLTGIVENNVASSADAIENLLQSQGQENNFFVLAIEPDYDRIDGGAVAVKKQIIAEAQITAPEHSINTLIKNQKKTEKYLTPSIMPSWQRALILIFTGIKKGCAYIYPHIKKGVVYLGKKLWQLIIKLSKKIFKKKVVPTATATVSTPPVTPNALIEIEKTYDTEGDILREAITETTIYTDTETTSIAPEADNYTKSKGILGMFSNWLNSQLAKIASMKRVQKIILLAVFLLVFAFSESVVLIGQGSEPAPLKQDQSIANQVEQKINMAEAQNIFNDSTGSKNLLKEAQTLLDKIPKKKNNLELISSLQAKIDSMKATVQKISSIDNPQLLFDLSQVNGANLAEAIAISGQNIIVSGGQNGNICKIDLAKKQVIANPLTEAGLNITKIASLDASNILFLDSTKGIFKYGLKATSSSNIIPASNISDMNYYSGNLYLLDKTKSQIAKYQIKNGKATGGAAVLKDNANLNQANSFAINGDFFVLKDNGEIKHYSRGQLVNTVYEAVDPALKAPAQLYAGTNDYLYILDKTGNKVVIYDNKGALKVQITSPKFTAIKSMAVNEKEKKVYLLTDNKIFVINTGL